MSFSTDMMLARVDAFGKHCDGCGKHPHPNTLSFYRIERTGRQLCCECFFEELGEEKHRAQQSNGFREALRERQFHSTIFMGSGKHSLRQKRDLFERLQHAFEFLGGSQQVPMSTDTKQCCDAYREFCSEADQVIDAAVRDIAVALTGKEWEPKNENP